VVWIFAQEDQVANSLEESIPASAFSSISFRLDPEKAEIHNIINNEQYLA